MVEKGFPECMLLPLSVTKYYIAVKVGIISVFYYDYYGGGQLTGGG